MHIRKYDFDYARRSFLERTARGLGGAGVLAPLWPTLCQAGDAAPDFDSLGGSMAAVVRNMHEIPASDREAIAAYLKSVPPLPNEN